MKKRVLTASAVVCTLSVLYKCQEGNALMNRTMKTMKRIIKTIPLLLLLFLCSCHHRNEVRRIDCQDAELILSKTIVLEDENERPMGQIKDFVVLEDMSVLCTDGFSVYRFDAEGRLKQRFGERGHATSEYVQLGNLYVTDRFFYAWDDMSLCLLQYTREGEFVAKYPGRHTSIRRFCVMGDSLACYYLAGKGGNQLLAMSLASDSVVYEIDPLSNEDLCLLSYVNSGGLAINQDTLYYLHPSEITLKKMDDVTPRTVAVYEDKGFHTMRQKTPPRGAQDLIDYVLDNSVVSGLSVDNGRFCITTETGVFGREGGVEGCAQRRLNVIMLDENFNIKQALRFSYPIGMTHYKMYYGRLCAICSDGERRLMLVYILPPEVIGQ